MLSTWIIPAFIAGFRVHPQLEAAFQKEENTPSVYRWVEFTRNWKRLSKGGNTRRHELADG